MKNGIILPLVMVVVLAISVVGTGSYLIINKLIAAPKGKESKVIPKASPKTETGEIIEQFGQKLEVEKTGSPSPISPLVALLTPTPTPPPTPTAIPTGGMIYAQPQKKYQIRLPSGWIVGSPTATSTYSTTKFTGQNGSSVSITFGTGKDPLGGCSEKSNVELFDRTIAGCYLLQKDGSQILTRAYTKDNASIDFTIEAYINPPLATNRQVVLDVIKTIDIE